MRASQPTTRLPIAAAAAVLLAALLALLSSPVTRAASAASAVPTDVASIINVVRTIDLTAAGIVREKTTAIFRAGSNAGGPVDHYLLGVPAGLAGHLSYVAVAERRDKNAAEVPLKPVELGVNRQAEVKREETQHVLGVLRRAFDLDLLLYRVQLQSPLKAGEKTYLDYSITMTQLAQPLPKIIPQMGRQLLMFAYDQYLPTPYFVEKQKTKFVLPSNNILSDQPGGTRSGNEITYGPHFDISPAKDDVVYLHYEHAMGILVAKSLSRELEISHWGSALGITEYWELHNKGAALKNNLFSRVDYQWSQGSHHLSNVVKGLRINLPPRAAHVYYRDDIGNVSTSHFRREPQRSLLEIRPRYPIFGGWRYSWHHTFDVPLADYMRRDKGTGKFVFQVPFISSFVNVTVEDVTFKLVLPEGATDVEVHVPFDADKTEVQKYYTNLDSVGRTLITIQKSNVADEYGRPIQVSYNLTTAALLRKPLVVAGCVFGLFLLGMVLSRLDFSIVADPNAAARDKVEQLRLSVSKTYRKYLTVAVTLKAAFDTYRASKDLAVFKERRAPLEAQQAELVAALRAAAKAARVPAASGTDGLPPSASAAALAAGADELAAKLGERGALLGALHDAVADFFTQADAAGGGVDEKRKAALTAKLDTTEERAGKIDADVRGIAAKLAL